MRVYPVALLLAALCVFAGPARAERLIELYQIALDRDPLLAAAYHRLNSKNNARIGSAMDYLPRAEASYEKSTNDQRIFRSDNAVFQKGHAVFGDDKVIVQASQPVLRADLIVKYQRSDLEQQKAKFDALAAEQNLISRLVESYLYVLAAVDGLQFADAELKALGEQLRLVEARQRAGTANAAEAAETGERYSQAEARLVDARNNLDDRFEGVAQIVGFRPTSVAPLGGGLPVIEVRERKADIWIDAALKQNPKLLSHEMDIRIADKDVDAQKVRVAPSVELHGEYNRDISGGSLFGGGSDVGTWRGVVQLRVPLLDSGSSYFGANSALDHKLQVQAEYDADRRSVVRNARNFLEGVVSGPRRIAALEKARTYSDSALKERRARLQAGQITTLELLDSIRNYYRVLRDLAAARYEYLNAYTKLKEAAGTLIENDVAMIDRYLANSRVSSAR